MPWLDRTWCGQEVYQDHKSWDNGAPVECNHYDCIDYNRNTYTNDSDDDSWSDDQEVQFLHECCGKLFLSPTAVDQHNAAKHHWCAPCDRFFNSAHSLAQHLSSSKDQPKSFICPKCPRGFVSPSSVVAHLESGTCPSRITRAIIDAYVAQADSNHIITNPNRMIEAGRPVDVRVPQPYPTYIVTQHAGNGNAWECCLCHIEFPYKAQLNQHLNSPKHAKRPGKMYRCPAAACQVQIETLSGLVQHVESGKCGIRQNRQVKDVMGALTSGLGQMRLTY